MIYPERPGPIEHLVGAAALFVGGAYQAFERLRGGAYAKLAESAEGLQEDYQQASIQYHQSPGLPTILLAQDLPELRRAHG